MEKSIVIKLEFEGIHAWPECNIPEVGFLKFPHRHIFHVTAKKVVTHNDRQIEIINLKRGMEAFVKRNGLDLGSASCEDIAESFIGHFQLSYCQVLEDNENGAEIFA